MNKLYSLLLFLSFNFFAFSQSSLYVSGETLSRYDITNGGFVTVNETEEIKGDRYLFTSYGLTGFIYTKDEKKYSVANLNYDAYLDRMTIRLSKDSLFAFNPGKIEKVIIGNHSFKRYLDPEFKRNSFYEIITETSGFEVLKRNTVEIKPGAINPLTKTKLAPDIYVKKSDYFIKYSGSDELKEFKLKKKYINELFNDKSLQVKEYASDNNLSYKDENDLIKIFNYYETL